MGKPTSTVITKTQLRRIKGLEKDTGLKRQELINRLLNLGEQHVDDLCKRNGNQPSIPPEGEGQRAAPATRTPAGAPAPSAGEPT